MKTNKPQVRMNLTVVSILLLAVVLNACGSFVQPDANKAIPVHRLQYPVADYSSLIKIRQEIVPWAHGENIDNILFYAHEGDQGLSQLVFPEDPECTLKTAYGIAGGFPDSHLQLLKKCFRKGAGTLTYLLDYNWDTGKIDNIAGPLPLGSSAVRWNPDRTRGVVHLDSGFAEETMFWVWKGGFGPMDLVISDRDLSWNLKNFYPNFLDDDNLTRKTGNAGWASWSSNGDTIAFFASPDAIGKIGGQRFYVEYGLYLMDSAQLQPRVVLDNVHFPYLNEWSPNSKYIAFAGQYGDLKQDGLWLYSLENNSVIQIAQGNFRDVLWSSNGNGLIAISCTENFDCFEIVRYDLTSVLNP